MVPPRTPKVPPQNCFLCDTLADSPRKINPYQYQYIILRWGSLLLNCYDNYPKGQPSRDCHQGTTIIGQPTNKNHQATTPRRETFYRLGTMLCAMVLFTNNQESQNWALWNPIIKSLRVEPYGTQYSRVSELSPMEPNIQESQSWALWGRVVGPYRTAAPCGGNLFVWGERDSHEGPREPWGTRNHEVGIWNHPNQIPTWTKAYHTNTYATASPEQYETYKM